MGPTGVVEADPLSDDALDHSVLLRAMRRDELLPEAITAHEARIGPRGEHQPVVGSQQERRRDASARPEPPRITRR